MQAEIGRSRPLSKQTYQREEDGVHDLSVLVILNRVCGVVQDVLIGSIGEPLDVELALVDLRTHSFKTRHSRSSIWCLIQRNCISDCDVLHWASNHHCVQFLMRLCGGLALHLVVELPHSLTIRLVLL